MLSECFWRVVQLLTPSVQLTLLSGGKQTYFTAFVHLWRKLHNFTTFSRLELPVFAAISPWSSRSVSAASSFAALFRSASRLSHPDATRPNQSCPRFRTWLRSSRNQLGRSDRFSQTRLHGLKIRPSPWRLSDICYGCRLSLSRVVRRRRKRCCRHYNRRSIL